MRKYLAPILCAFMLAGTTTACHHEPPPRAPKAKRVRKTAVVTQFVVTENRISIPGPILFRTGTADLDPVSEPSLEVVLDYMASKPEVTLLRIEGHTDSDGNPAANEGLSERRALAVAHWLTDAGVDCRRLLPVGFGQDKPVVPNDSADHKAQNRRVAFLLANISGRAIGPSPDGGGRPAGDACR
jgi:OOP family OmpA-OmpF porin